MSGEQHTPAGPERALPAGRELEGEADLKGSQEFKRAKSNKQ